MLYEKSKYCIEYNENDVRYIFSTKTAKIIELSESAYIDIFVNGQFNDYESEIKQLLDAEILVGDCYVQEDELLEKRKETIAEHNNRTIQNYVITPTMACNARCSYCFEKDVHHDTMNSETARDVANFIINNYDDEPISIHWFGGEPLLAPHIIDDISIQLKKAGIDFISKITTNGFYLTKEITRKALDIWNVEYVQVTIDGIGEEYNRIKNYKNENCNAFEIVMDNIQKSLNEGLKVRIRNNYDPENFHKPQEIIDYTRKKFGDNPNLIYHMHALFSDDVTSINGKFENSKKHPFISVLEIEEENEKKLSVNTNWKTERSEKQKAKFTAWCDPRVYIDGDIATKILCKHMLYPVPTHCIGICDNSIAIDSHGDIFVCHSMLGKGREYSSGNVKSGIDRNDIYKYYQSELIEEKMCKYCNLLPLCQGGCRFKRNMYDSNQFCIPIKGCAEEALKHAVEEIRTMTGSLDALK